MTQLMQKKALATKRLADTSKRMLNDISGNQDEHKFQMLSMEMFAKELNETEKMIVQAMQWLENVLKGDYKNVVTLVENSRQRLDTLRDAALREEHEHNRILKAGEQLNKYNQSHMEGVIDGILNDVAIAADQLEEELDEHIFEEAVHNRLGPRNIEAVIRLGENDTDFEEGSVIKLVDAADNQFVLAKGKDSTVPHEDHQLIKDLICLTVATTFFGWICTILSLPPMFGFILGGVVVGPSGFNTIKSNVQVETMGEFGMFFILLCVGLEFSPTTLRKVLRVATLGSGAMMSLMVALGLILGRLWSASGSESVFVAACLSLSSTPLVIKFLTSSSDVKEENLSSSDYGVVLLGILIMQDVYLGILMALLPNMALGSGTQILDVLLIIINLIAAMAFVLCACFFGAKIIIGPLYKYLVRKGNKELTVLVTVSLAFLALMGTNYLHISMELGCFLAGIVISAQGHGLGDEVENLIQPLKDFLSAIFFGSIGLHVFPQFLSYEMTVLTTLTIICVGAKYLISVLVLALLIPRSSWHVKWIASAGLAQVSEFSFVLSSRARRLGLISREVYLLILAVTSLSQLFAPILWKFTLWHLRINQRKSPRALRQNSLNLPAIPESFGAVESDTHLIQRTP
ncbi:hypothetical protein CAPTEDRAFT_161515 [Capitella teleta]|uniref:Cation/H+ exchanger transmembrane domain-containing protein n=1 Tax=Capitella teleta TaxID=283909 RepID=R7TW19_CAPTE|nr:hypothetical protein CAPTEDRAFT_161515 [Capitella teleta]|eukprot:ELT97777.1 hypothetical protein CAPTEDRAFT_161515 [Capitella teleta]